MCQPCYRYFIQNNCKLFIKPQYGQILTVQDNKDAQYGQLICHECGKAFTKLQQHIYYAHNMSRQEYCNKWGLDKGIQLTTNDYHNKMVNYANQYNMGEQLKCTGKNTRFKKGHTNNYERSYQTKQRLVKWGTYLGNKYNLGKNNKCKKEINNMEQDLTNFYFIDDEYNILSSDYMYKNNYEDKYVKDNRDSIKQKLLDLNTEILSQIKKDKLDLHNHFNTKNIISLTYPCPRNKDKVDWIGVRYGVSKRTISLINGPEKFDEHSDFGFLKFGCLQISISSTGVQVQLVHSIPNDSFDRGYLHDNLMKDTQLQNNIIESLKPLKGLGFKWYFGNECVKLDDYEPEEFINLYNTKDQFHTYSMLTLEIPKTDERLLESNIHNLYKYIKLLYPLYNTLKFPIKL